MVPTELPNVVCTTTTVVTTTGAGGDDGEGGSVVPVTHEWPSITPRTLLAITAPPGVAQDFLDLNVYVRVGYKLS